MVFLENLANGMGAPVSFSDIQTHEARSGEEKDRVDDQMEKDASWSLSTDFTAAPDIHGALDEEQHVTNSVKIWKSSS